MKPNKKISPALTATCICMAILFVAIIAYMGIRQKLNTEPYDPAAKPTYTDIEETVGFSGRWYEKEIDGRNFHVTVNDGAMLYFKTKGTNIVDVYFLEITSGETPYFAYSIDDGVMTRQKITESSILLPDEGEHIVRIVVDGMSEYEDKWNGEMGVAFEYVDGHDGTISGVLPKQKRILFVGDSITEGVMALGNISTSEFNSATNSFPWHTAQALGAEPYFVGFGSTGIGSAGSFNTTSVTLDYLSASRPVEENDIPACDLIVLNTGTNDYNLESGLFIAGYQEVLAKLHVRYPNVEVMCMIPFTQGHAQDIRDAVAGYEWCHVVETADWEFTYTDGIHPDAEGAKIVAAKLTEEIQKQKNW